MATTTTTTTKTTNVMALSYVLENCSLPSEVAEKIANIKASYVKKSEYKGEKKATPSAEKPENVALFGEIKEFLAQNGKATISEIIKGIGNADLSTSKVSSLLKPHLVSGKVVREEIKRKAYFSLAE